MAAARRRQPGGSGHWFRSDSMLRSTP